MKTKQQKQKEKLADFSIGLLARDIVLIRFYYFLFRNWQNNMVAGLISVSVFLGTFLQFILLLFPPEGILFLKGNKKNLLLLSTG